MIKNLMEKENQSDIELSIVMPCLNEAETLAEPERLPGRPHRAALWRGPRELSARLGSLPIDRRAAATEASEH